MQEERPRGLETTSKFGSGTQNGEAILSTNTLYMSQGMKGLKEYTRVKIKIHHPHQIHDTSEIN